MTKRQSSLTLLLTTVCLFAAMPIAAQDEKGSDQKAADDKAPQAVTSTVGTAKNGDVYIVQEILFDAPVKKVWAACTTSEGWQGWVAPRAKVDLKIGGLIKTNYRKDAAAEDDDWNTLHIINYVPERVLTLQAEVGKNWPAVMKEREKQMYNVITFEALGEKKTKVVSYGIGYRDTPESQQLLKFFVPANESAYKKLIEYVKK